MHKHPFLSLAGGGVNPSQVAVNKRISQKASILYHPNPDEIYLNALSLKKLAPASSGESSKYALGKPQKTFLY